MTTATLLPNGKQQFLSDNGDPLVGGKVYFYIPNTTTPKNTWQDEGQTILNTNPVILDSRGEAVIYGTGRYRQVLTDSLDNTIYDVLTQDLLSLFPAQDVYWGGIAGGSGNVLTITTSPILAALTVGQVFEVIVNLSNTGPATLQINAVSPLAIKVNSVSGPVALTANELVSGNRAVFFYDGTQIILLNPAVGITPTIGDSSTQLATTAFVANLGIKFNGFSGYTAAVVLPSSDLGKIVRLGSGGYTATLPLATSDGVGKVLALMNFSALDITIARQGADIIFAGFGGSTSFTMKPGDVVFMAINASTEWTLLSGSAQLPYSGQFASSKVANGYQKLPSGLIIQWGAVGLPDNTAVNVTLPITFPSAIFATYASVDLSFTGGASEFNCVGAQPIGVLNQIQVNHNSGPSTSVSAIVYWLAIGA